MIDPSVLASVAPLTGGGTSPIQALPQPQSRDVMRFDDVVSGKLDLSVFNSKPADGSVLQVNEAGSSVEPSSFKDMVVNRLEGLDNSYSSILDQMNNHRSFSDYLGETQAGGAGETSRTYPENISTSKTDDLSSAVDEMQKTQTAALSFQKDTAAWTLNAQMWATTINLASAAVNQVAQGFKTLFRASG